MSRVAEQRARQRKRARDAQHERSRGFSSNHILRKMFRSPAFRRNVTGFAGLPFKLSPEDWTTKPSTAIHSPTKKTKAEMNEAVR